jgi:hypothetical protein
MISRMDRLLFFLTLFIFFEGFLKADSFLLKNGNVLEGTLKSETEEEYEVEIAGGTTRIKKNAVLKIEKDSGTLTPRAEFEQKKKLAETPEALIAAAEFGIKNGLNAESLPLLKRAWIQNKRKDDALKGRIQNLEEKHVSEIFNKAQKLFDALKYRSCASLLNRTLKQDFFSTPLSLLQLRKEVYAHLDAEQTSHEYLEQLLQTQKQYTRKKASKKISPPSPPSKDTISPAQEFRTRQMKLDPVYSQMVDSLIQLFELQEFIERGQGGLLASQELHSVKELDQARAKPEEFIRFRTENNNIYQARKHCRQYNYLLDEAKAQMQRMDEILQNENKSWIAKGFEKVNGQWLKGDEAKEAKGLERYRGEWMDPKDPDCTKKKAAIDKKYEMPQPTLDIKKPEEKSTSKIPSSIQEESNQDLSLVEDRKNLVTNIKASIQQELNQAVTQKMEDTKKQVKSLQHSVSEIIKEQFFEKYKGLSLPLGLGLIVGLLFFLKWSKRKK